VLRPEARATQRSPLLASWNAPFTDLLTFILFVISGSFFAAITAGFLVKRLPLRGDEVTVFNGAAAQLGMLAGVVVYWMRPEHSPPRSHPAGENIFISGAMAFLMALPLVIVATYAWHAVLTLCGVSIERQDLIGIFANAESPWMLAILIFLALVIAPLTEELVFRAGLYRFLRSRISRPVALASTAIVFACMHVNLATFVPLVVLALVFSLAYERTGRIGTPIVAHALFNLNTVVIILCGVEV
jgi:hypothetical protein